MKFDICHAINFAEKGVAHHVPVLFVGTLNECLARKVKFHQSSMWEGCQLQLALPMLHGHVMNIIHMYVYFFLCVCSIYIYIVLPKYQPPPALSPSKAMASKEYWAQMVALWPGNECVQQFNPQAPFFI